MKRSRSKDIQSKVASLYEAQRNSPEHQEQRLRELCAWYEWSEPPNIAAASVLQDAADAVRVGAMSAKAADIIANAWQPFVRYEADAGNLPPPIPTENVPLGVLRVAVKELGKMLKEAQAPEDRRRLTKLLNRQISIYQRAEKEGHK